MKSTVVWSAVLLLVAAVSGRPQQPEEISSLQLPEGWQRVGQPQPPQEAVEAPGVDETVLEEPKEIPVELVFEGSRVSRQERSSSLGYRRRRGIFSGFQPQHQLQQQTIPAAMEEDHQVIREGPSIVRLKVRRGGVAIAGPGGVASAGSGGTAIVGPGGTAYTTADGTAVVGPGGRLVHVEEDPYVVRARSTGRLVATGPLIYYPTQHYP